MDKVELLDTTIKLVIETMLEKNKMTKRLKARKSQLVENQPIWAQLRVMLEVALALVEENKSFLNNNSSLRTKRLMCLTFPQHLLSRAELKIMMMVKIKRRVLNKLRNQRTENIY